MCEVIESLLADRLAAARARNKSRKAHCDSTMHRRHLNACTRFLCDIIHHKIYLERRGNTGKTPLAALCARLYCCCYIQRELFVIWCWFYLRALLSESCFLHFVSAARTTRLNDFLMSARPQFECTPGFAIVLAVFRHYLCVCLHLMLIRFCQARWVVVELARCSLTLCSQK